ncbi:uncharacterized protein LOC142767701 [Rhipicephalus microplus]|uniref:uncharacterized protein LOC142767701 n=1 Tax=Rhipicephalus microplus TaxID=6941 RepID=UPI003F6BACDE
MQGVPLRALLSVPFRPKNFAHPYAMADKGVVTSKQSFNVQRELLGANAEANVVFSVIHCGSRIPLDNVPFPVVKGTAKHASTADWPKECTEKVNKPPRHKEEGS